MKNNSVILILVLWASTLFAKQPKFATELVPLVDSNVHRFTNIYEFMPLYYNAKNIDSYVKKILGTTDYAMQKKYFDKILATRTPAALCLCAFDYYFQKQAPVKGTNVEQFLTIVKAHNLAPKINTAFKYNLKENANLKDSVWVKIGWQFGHGAFYYLSPADSMYMAKMQQHNTATIDEKIIEIIENSIDQQHPIHNYHAEDIMKELKAIPELLNVIHDGCLSKTMQLPNWDKIYIEYIDGKDTIERVYTIQIGKGSSFIKYALNNYVLRFAKMHLNTGTDVVWFKNVNFCLHGYRRTKVQCDINQKQQEEGRMQYEDFLRNKK